MSRRKNAHANLEDKDGKERSTATVWPRARTTTVRSPSRIVEVQGEYGEGQEFFELELEQALLKLERARLKRGNMPGWQLIMETREIDGAFWDASAILDPKGRVSISLTDTTGFAIRDEEEHRDIWPTVEPWAKDEHHRLYGELKPKKLPKPTKAQAAEGKKIMAELRRLAAEIRAGR